jgi:hypothetical protein
MAGSSVKRKYKYKHGDTVVVMHDGANSAGSQDAPRKVRRGDLIKIEAGGPEDVRYATKHHDKQWLRHEHIRPLPREGQTVRVLRNTVKAHVHASDNQIEPGAQVLVDEVRMQKAGGVHQLCIFYKRASGKCRNYIPISDVEVLTTSEPKVGDTVRVLRNNAEAMQLDRMQPLKRGDTVIVDGIGQDTFNSGRFPTVRYMRKSGGRHCIPIQDVEVVKTKQTEVTEPETPEEPMSKTEEVSLNADRLKLIEKLDAQLKAIETAKAETATANAAAMDTAMLQQEKEHPDAEHGKAEYVLKHVVHNATIFEEKKTFLADCSDDQTPLTQSEHTALFLLKTDDRSGIVEWGIDD